MEILVIFAGVAGFAYQSMQNAKREAKREAENAKREAENAKREAERIAKREFDEQKFAHDKAIQLARLSAQQRADYDKFINELSNQDVTTSEILSDNANEAFINDLINEVDSISTNPLNSNSAGSNSTDLWEF